MPFSLTKKTSQQPTRPPGPQGLNRPASMLSFQRAPLRFLTDLTRQYGDIAQFPLLTQPVYFLNHPDHLRYILQEHHYNYDRNMPLVSLVRLIVGNGLSTNTDQESWLRQRRLIQPAFHKQSIAAFGSLLCTETLAILERWEEQAKSGQPVNIAHEMEEVTLHIVSKAMFHRDFTRQSQLFIRSFQLAHQILGEHLRFPFPPLSLPTPRHRQFRAAIQQMDEMVYDIIRQHRQQNHHDHDLLSMLLSAVDEETGTGMSDQQIHDEVITFLAAGSETTACTLTWMWYLLSQHPTVEQRLLAELNETLAGAPPTVDDLPRLPYARMIIDETLRLYPPIWLLMRNTVQDDRIGTYDVPAKTLILFSPYILHRHPDFWEEPEHFDPERFTPERLAKLPRGSYIPFGHGPHLCIGQGFALQEMVLMLALIAQRYRLILAPDHRVEPLPLISLHIRHGLPMHLHPR